MSQGKYLSLEEARKKDRRGKDKLDRFCEDHPSSGKKKDFDALLTAMVQSSSEGEGTSSRESGEG